jgi:hypothetical protein
VITIDNPKDPAIQAIFLKGNLRMLSRGFKHSRMSGKQALALATELTAIPYKRGQYAEAISDLQTIINEGKP